MTDPERDRLEGLRLSRAVVDARHSFEWYPSDRNATYLTKAQDALAAFDAARRADAEQGET